jgi:chromosome segregation ATPase
MPVGSPGCAPTEFPSWDGTLAEHTDSLEKLEQKLLKAVDLFKRQHAEKRALQQEVEELRSEVKDRPKRFEALERDLEVLRRERDDVRKRIEKLLDQIETLTNGDSGA